MNGLGIYFGSKVISLIETKSNKVVNNIKISRVAVAASETEGKLSEEVKIVALFKDELRRNNVEAKEANLCLSGKDLIIRTFDMPILPAREFKSAVGFEAKKYVPFKLEELISSYQVILDKPNKKNIILYVSIKKDILEKYFLILQQLGLKAVSVEYSGFSVLRLLQLNRLNYKNIVALISTDFQEEDEINFTVLENGFPLFSRDIALLIGQEAQSAPKPEERPAGIVSEKLKTEIRVSLDYFHRKFPAKNVSKVFFIINKEYRPQLEVFVKEFGLGAEFIDLEPYIGKSVAFSASFIKAYSSSLAQGIKVPLKIDLIGAREDALRDLKAAEGFSLTALLRGLVVDPKAIIGGVLICAAAFGLGIYQKVPVEQELNNTIAMRPQIPGVDTKASYEELSATSAKYKQKIKVLNETIKSQFYFTDIFNVMPGLIPKGVWLNSFEFLKTLDKDGQKLNIKLDGMVYSLDKNEEFDLVNEFVANLKAEDSLNKYFKEINILTLNSKNIGQATVTTFVIDCRGAYKEK